MKTLTAALPILLGAILCGAGAASAQSMHNGAIMNTNFPPIPIPPQAAAAGRYGVAADASNAFAFDLYAKLRGTGGGNDNLFFSPYSLDSAISMAYLGARGRTAQEMLPVLGFHFINKAFRSPEEDRADVESSYAALNRSLRTDAKKKGVTLNIANALWAQKGDPLAPDYLAAVKNDFDADLTPVKKLTGQLASRSVKLTLPKWQATQSFQLGQTLAGMGMKLAFTPQADFSGINGQSGLFLSDVVHKAFIDVDEQGTEAAAASAASAAGGFELPAAPVKFTADHPFIYMIVHDPGDTILFTGRLCDPSPAK
jgi:serine protease inhibitor